VSYSEAKLLAEIESLYRERFAARSFAMRLAIGRVYAVSPSRSGRIRLVCLCSATATLVGVRLAVGDVVVYAAHGVGRIAAREKRMVLGATQEILVLELADGLFVTLPVERARELLRPLLSKADLRRVQATLREDHTLNEDVWTKRKKDTQAKLKDGDPFGLAEVVRDGARREQRLIAKHTGSQLSPSERDLYKRARRLLSAEIGLARDLEPAEADAWIAEQLTTTA
jgi:CarD family transcriptional regulator